MLVTSSHEPKSHHEARFIGDGSILGGSLLSGKTWLHLWFYDVEEIFECFHLHSVTFLEAVRSQVCQNVRKTFPLAPQQVNSCTVARRNQQRWIQSQRGGAKSSNRSNNRSSSHH